MPHQKITIMGIPIDNMNLDESIQEILSYIDKFPKEKKSRYIGTINVDFLANTQSCCWNSVRYPELLKVLRESVVATPDGKPIIWLSRLLHSPLKERVSGSDLFPLLANALGSRGKSIYLLGGDEHIAEATGELLTTLYPGLKIAGTSSPFVYIDGINLVNASDRDDLVVEHINSTAPHLLVINFGNPKQEIWFHRVKDRLRVPVSIGVGGTFALTVGAIKRAPKWMQHSGLEWLYRLIQEPGRLWKRYFFGGIKFLVQTIPLVVYHNVSLLAWKIRHLWSHSENIKHPHLFLSSEQSLTVISFPQLLDGTAAEKLNKFLDEAFNQEAIVIDFNNLRHITLEGISFLLALGMKVKEANKEVFAIRISKDIRTLLKLHRIWDVFEYMDVETPRGVLERLTYLHIKPTFFESVQQNKDKVTISFFGNIAQDVDYDKYLERVAPILYGKECILDFHYCTDIENRGFSFLLRLRDLVAKEGRSLSITGLNSEITWLFKLHKVNHLFKIV